MLYATYKSRGHCGNQGMVHVGWRVRIRTSCHADCIACEVRGAVALTWSTVPERAGAQNRVQHDCWQGRSWPHRGRMIERRKPRDRARSKRTWVTANAAWVPEASSAGFANALGSGNGEQCRREPPRCGNRNNKIGMNCLRFQRDRGR